jgi:hypothetical protein
VIREQVTHQEEEEENNVEVRSDDGTSIGKRAKSGSSKLLAQKLKFDKAQTSKNVS